MKQSTIAAIACLASSVFAHGGVYTYTIDGVDYPGYKFTEPPESQSNLIQRRWYYWPVEDPLSPNVTCSYDGSAVKDTYHAPVKAGDTITASWSNNLTWDDPNGPFYCEPGSTRDCFYRRWYHFYGPLMAYMADCGGDCSTVDPAALKWFKIAEEGLKPGFTLGDTAGWEQSALSRPGTKGWSVTVPKSLKPGNYMIRHEILMIELMPPQFYPTCGQLKVEGSGTATPSEDYLVKFPGAYSMEDPGIAISGVVYGELGRNTTEYIIPGPKVWTG
ncbi:lytic polysaccharide monooxygenase [Aaosphaeria arxii CBS 175.79]|uniref:AA9 family lytic polysaccharide monooxygenase n=1 Tax=Aaosphaeria arxii CBS 175.79 TaxID=1450172 RepID=A0A6A5Y635_9PLEO|nr:lytic polysaccharide monooxygenase [Aaosphaeria arxii CBS 175.79]KAF2020769.1 lytic polysaccharide monooxygenase [Aaosphaeria arxii CBS 175.79]